MRIYVSGPVTDIVDLNRPAFDRAAATARAGYDTVNPLDICPLRLRAGPTRCAWTSRSW
jgi:hypothetical protein